MKTKEELNELKTEYETLSTKLQELTEDELNMVIGGISIKLPSYAEKITIEAGYYYANSIKNIIYYVSLTTTCYIGTSIVVEEYWKDEEGDFMFRDFYTCLAEDFPRDNKISTESLPPIV